MADWIFYIDDNGKRRVRGRWFLLGALVIFYVAVLA